MYRNSSPVATPFLKVNLVDEWSYNWNLVASQEVMVNLSCIFLPERVAAPVIFAEIAQVIF